MTKYRIFKVKGKNYKRSSRIKVEQITSSIIIDGEKIIPKNLGDRRIIKHYTTTAEGYQLKVVWWYQCKKDYPLWHKDAIGTSFKPRKGEDYITKVTQLPLQQMLKDADAMAWINYKCSPLAEFRKTVILEHYLPAKESPISKMVTVHRQKKENIKEYTYLLNKIDIDESYRYNKEIANRDKRSFISREDFTILRKIVRNEKLTEKEQKKEQRVKRENWNYIELVKKVRKYKK